MSRSAWANRNTSSETLRTGTYVRMRIRACRGSAMQWRKADEEDDNDDDCEKGGGGGGGGKDLVMEMAEARKEMYYAESII